MSMTPARLGASSTCAMPTADEPNANARTIQRIHRRTVMVRSLRCPAQSSAGRANVTALSRRDVMRIGSSVIAVVLAATSVLAHHSNSAFDGDKVMVLTGTVTEWKWTNPHVWIFLSVDEGNGGKAQGSIEGRTPGQVGRP